MTTGQSEEPRARAETQVCACTDRRGEFVRILGIPFVISTAHAMVSRLHREASRGPLRLAFANAHTINLAHRDIRLREALQTADYVLNDGIGVALAARWLGGESFPENLNGSDFTTRLLHMAAREGWSVFLLGGRGGVAWEAGERLRESIPRLQIVGCRHGYHYDSAADVDAIRRAKPDVLLVAMGNPHQEVWLHQHWKALPSIRLAVGVGAYLDFQAGVVPRAPRWMNDCGIEWVYRLAREPFRLGRRYVIGNPVFVLRVLLAGRSGSEARTARRHGLRDMT